MACATATATVSILNITKLNVTTPPLLLDLHSASPPARLWCRPRGDRDSGARRSVAHGEDIWKQRQNCISLMVQPCDAVLGTGPQQLLTPLLFWYRDTPSAKAIPRLPPVLQRGICEVEDDYDINQTGCPLTLPRDDASLAPF